MTHCTGLLTRDISHVRVRLPHGMGQRPLPTGSSVIRTVLSLGTFPRDSGFLEKWPFRPKKCQKTLKCQFGRLRGFPKKGCIFQGSRIYAPLHIRK